MKSIDLTPYLLGGLRPDRKNVFGVNSMLDAHGCRITEYGLVSPPEVYQPFIAPVLPPFPMLFDGEQGLVLAEKEDIQLVTDGWALSAVSLNTLGSYDDGVFSATPTTIPAIGQWQFADYTNGWFLFNGQCVVFTVPSVGTFMSSFPKAGTGCFHKGRMFFADLEDFYSAAYIARLASLGIDVEMLKKNSLYYTAVDCEDMLWPFFPWMVETQAQYLKVMERREGNDTDLPWKDRVLCVKPLGEGVVVYGEHHISYAQVERNVLAFKHPFNFGSLSRAVGGGKSVHAFIDEMGNLKLLGADLSIKDLNYSEFFEQFDPMTITISEYGTTGDFIITGDKGSYFFSGGKLTKLTDIVTSVINRGNTPVGCYEEKNRYFNVLTGIVRTNNPLFTVKGIRIGSTHPTSVKGSLHYRDHSSGPFYQTDLVQFSDDGIVDLKQSASELAVELTSEFVDVNVSSLELLYNDDRISL